MCITDEWLNFFDELINCLFEIFWLFVILNKAQRSEESPRLLLPRSDKKRAPVILNEAQRSEESPRLLLPRSDKNETKTTNNL
jgi:hypothetical protein